MKFIEYIVLLESDLEDMELSEEATENIELLHEIEYKLGKLIESKYNLNEKMYVNLIKRFTNLAIDSYNDLSEKFDDLLSHWLTLHQIEEPHEWAKQAYEDSEEYVDELKEVSRGDVTITQDELINGLSHEAFKDLLEYNVGDIETWGYANSGYFLASIDAPVPDDVEEDEHDEYWEENPSEAEDYINEHNLNDQFVNYIIDNAKNTGFFEDATIDRDTWIMGIEEILYPKYYDKHGYNIETVIPDVEEDVERIRLTDDAVATIPKLFEHLHPDDVKLDYAVKHIYKIVGRMTTAISLAMNTVHTSGNIMEFYGDQFGLGDVDKDFLDYFHTRNVEDWNAELGKIKVTV